jgi:hypothetical protein
MALGMALGSHLYSMSSHGSRVAGAGEGVGMGVSLHHGVLPRAASICCISSSAGPIVCVPMDRRWPCSARCSIPL